MFLMVFLGGNLSGTNSCQDVFHKENKLSTMKEERLFFLWYFSDIEIIGHGYFKQ